MNIIILNSSLSTKTKNPPCLFKCSNKQTLLEKQIKILNKSFNNPNIYIIVGVKYKKIKSLIDQFANVSIIENLEFETTSCLYNIGLIQKITSPVLILQDNILFSETIFKNLNTDISQIWISKESQDIGCVINNEKIEHMMFDLPNYWGNISLLTNFEFKLLQDLYHSNQVIDKWFLLEGLNWIIENGGHIQPIYRKGKITTIRKFSDLHV